MELISSSALVASAATYAGPIIVVVRDAHGAALPDALVRIDVQLGGGWVAQPVTRTSALGQASITWYLGPDPLLSQQIRVRAGLVSLTIEATAVPPVRGTPRFGENQFVEWTAGDLPIVISAPHGGVLLPSEIPDRTSGTSARDVNTEELARAVSDAFLEMTGSQPSVIICRLSRRKLDANREIVEAAQGVASAEQAWREYHAAIDASLIDAVREHGKAFYIDLHGHGHDAQRLELGYLLSSPTLGLSDAELAANAALGNTSISTMASGSALVAALRGPGSLGALFDAEGLASVPSPRFPDPGGLPYFDGGYSTGQHARDAAGLVAGLQIETHFTGVRATAADRTAFGRAVVHVLGSFLPAHGWPFAQLPDIVGPMTKAVSPKGSVTPNVQAPPSSFHGGGNYRPR